MARLGIGHAALKPFSALLASLSSESAGRRDSIGADRAVRIIVRVCQLPFFRLSVFPRICLRQSLALYRFLQAMGYPVQLHVGVHKSLGGLLEAHSWVSVDGQPIADDAPLDMFRVLYSYPSEEERWPNSVQRLFTTTTQSL